MSLSCTISDIWQDIGQKSPILTHPPLFGAPFSGDAIKILPRSLKSET